MYHPNTMRAAPVRCRCCFLSIIIAPLGRAQRFSTLNKKHRKFSPERAGDYPHASAMYPTKFARLYFLLLLCAVLVAGIDARAVQAFEAVVINARTPGHPWCVTHKGSDAPAVCEYDNYLTCGMAAIAASGSCKHRRSSVTAASVSLPRPRKLSAAKPPLQKRESAPTSDNDDLFRKFVQWSSKTQLSAPQSTTIVVSAEPEAFVTPTKAALSEAEPANPEPVAGKPRTQQIHLSGEWLIQIGAFDGEAEARQHLSEARFKAGAALVAADPFTERVQTGDRVLYRARFAGFDKKAAEVACTQLKRGHFECVTLKK